MQSASFKIWFSATKIISYDENYYAKSTFLLYMYFFSIYMNVN